MRKRKKRSCGLCHPNKVGWEKRWTNKEVQSIKLADKEIRNA